jgi:hypothetical protein
MITYSAAVTFFSLKKPPKNPKKETEKREKNKKKKNTKRERKRKWRWCL